MWRIEQGTIENFYTKRIGVGLLPETCTFFEYKEMKQYNKDNTLGRISANKIMLGWVNKEIEKCKERKPIPNTPAQIALGGRLKSLYNVRGKIESMIEKARLKLLDKTE